MANHGAIHETLHGPLPNSNLVQVSITIANWNRSALLRDCLLSVLTTPKSLTYEIIVVDNASTDDSVHLVSTEFPGVRLIENATNLGFGRAHNQAIAAARGRYIVALNNDATVLPGTIPTLIAFMDRQPRVGVCTCPALLDEHSPWATGGGMDHFPSLTREIASNLLELFRPPFGLGISNLIAPLSRRVAGWSPMDQEHEVHWARGALLVLRRAMLDHIGGFDERFFVFFEEVDLCRRARDAGWSVYYTPATSYFHLGQQSTTSAQRERFYRTAGYGYFRKHANLSTALLFAFQHYFLRQMLLFLRSSIGRGFRAALRHNPSDPPVTPSQTLRRERGVGVATRARSPIRNEHATNEHRGTPRIRLRRQANESSTTQVRRGAHTMPTISDAMAAPPTTSTRTALPFDSVVIISPFFWNFRDDMWQTTHNIALQFGRRVPTIFVEPSAPWNAGSEQFRLSRLLTSLVGRRTRNAAPNLLVFSRRSLPGGRFEAVRSFDHRRNTKVLRRLLDRAGFQQTLLWHSFPYWSQSWIDAIDHEFLAYHSLDYSPRDEEAQIIRRADVVFCVSETLVDKHKTINPRTHLLPNGVDLDLFDRHKADTTPRPLDLPRDGHLIGFVGSINCHLDFELLEAIAQHFPQDSLILVGRLLTNETAPRGRQADALSRLRQLRNVHLLGFKPSEELRAYMNAFDVCLIPFLANSFNQECDPLKFYQYVAFGKPVVATAAVPVAQRYHKVCYPAASREDFLRQLQLALRDGADSDLVQRRIAIAEAHSWDSLVARAIGTIGQLLTEKRPAGSLRTGKGQ